MVGGLVEQQRVGLGGQHLRQQHPQLEASRQGGQRLAVHLGGDAEPFQHLAGSRLEGVAVVMQDQLLELRVAVGVELGSRTVVLVLAMRQHPLLFDHRLPDVVVAHHRHLQDGHRFVTEVVLAQDAELEALGNGQGAGAGLLLTGKDAQEGRFPRAVRPHQAIAVAGVELDRDPLEQRLGAVGLGEVGYRDHRAWNDSTRPPLRTRRATLHRVCSATWRR